MKPTRNALTPRKRPDWMDEAACVGQGSLFFPGGGSLGAVNAAKRICATCPVVDACLSYALAYEEMDGVWGRTSGEERRAMLNKRRRAVRRPTYPGTVEP